MMETLNELENSIVGLSAEDYKRFRDWFFGYEQQKLDTKIEADVNNNKLDALAKTALQDFRKNVYSSF